MQSDRAMRTPLGWAAVLLLIAVGFIGGLTVAGGGGRSGSELQAVVTTPAVVAAPDPTGVMSSADVAELTMPAVVNVSTDKVVESNWQHPFMEDPFFRRFFGPPRGEGQERVERSLGSGVVVSSDGFILTNNHVVEMASKIRITFEGNEEYEAEVIGTDPQTDVALIKIEAENLPYLSFGDSDVLRIGEQVMAIGNPFGLGQTVTMGIVSAKGRSIGLIDYEDLIQTDATINPGNSGGALVNARGELVGMSTAIVSRSGGSQGIGFAIPSNMALRVMNELREHGKVERAWLGVTIREVNQSIADYYGMDRPRGVLINSVNEDTPAERAGLREGDIILSVDDEEIDSVSQLRNRVSLSPVGEEVDLRVLRDGKEKNIGVTLDELPAEAVLASTGERLGDEDDGGIDGVKVQSLTPQRRRMAEVPDDIEGVIVVEVDRRSNASREGLVAGDVIIEVDKQQVEDLADYRRLVGKDEDKPILLRVYKPQGGGLLFMAIPR